MKKYIRIKLEPLGDKCVFFKVLEIEGIEKDISIKVNYHCSSLSILINSNTEFIYNFDTTKERDEFVAFIKEEIFSDKLFSINREPKYGDTVLVKDLDVEDWYERKFVLMLPEKYFNRYVCENPINSQSTHPWRKMKLNYNIPFMQVDTFEYEYGEI